MNFVAKIAEASINARIQAEAGFSAIERGMAIEAYNVAMAGSKRARRCVIPGCSATTIGCHTIQASGALELLAENQKLIAPRYRPHKGHEPVLIGLWEATTAQMFCQHHDTTLFGFERTKGVATDEDAALQIARSIVREQSILKLRCASLPRLLKQAIAKHKKKAAAIVSEELRRMGLDQYRHAIDIADRNRHIWAAAQETIDRHNQALAMLDGMLVSALEILQGMKSNSLRILAIDLRTTLPFAFSCFSSFGTRNGAIPKHPIYNPGHHHIMVAACIPSLAGTKLIIAVAREREAAFHTLLDAKGLVEDPGTADELRRWVIFAEQMMLSSGDHYFVRPSAYDALDDEAKARLLPMLNRRGALLDDWPSPIF